MENNNHHKTALDDCLLAGFPLSRDNLYLTCTFAHVGDMGIVSSDVSVEKEGLEQLAEEICLEIEGVKFEARFLGARLAIMMQSKDLSSNISTNFTNPKQPYKQIIAKTEAAKHTARVLNIFLRKIAALLQNHPINKRRNLKANAILVRDVVRLSFAELHKVRIG
jgi:2,3-bisphosphoglycerate-independent phosphoglycerate mutase